MSTTSSYVKFEDSLEDDDWGLIISNDGRLKGMFIPKGSDEAQVPTILLEICAKYFGINPIDEQETIH